MCKSELHEFLCALPKCEHHVHIEGTITPELLFGLAARNQISFPESDPAYASIDALHARYRQFTSLDDFLQYYFIGFTVLLTADDFAELTYTYLKLAYSQNVRHAEIFFDPAVHKLRGVAYDTIIEGMTRARKLATAQLPGLSVEFIPCHVRHLPLQSGLDMINDILQAGHIEDGTVVGIGMSSTELGMHPSTYESLYDAARKAGVSNLTAHAGEEGPAEYVAAAISHLGVGRIDHGRRAAEDVSLLQRLGDADVMLTLCPISNVVLKGISGIEHLPLREFLEAGISFSINSDDPAYFGGWIQENYCAVQDAFNFSVPEWEIITKGAIGGSWCSATRKGELTALVDTVLEKWSGQGAL